MAQVRAKFLTRKIRLVGEQQRETAIAMLRNLPIDTEHPLEIVAREEVKERKPEQNSLMWSGPLKDIEQQAWVDGRQFKDTVWHEHFKELFLPDPDSPDFDSSHVKDGYRKYDYTPDGKRVLIGSTTELTVNGFAVYLEQVIAFGANLGVQFHASPNESRRTA